MSRNRLAAEQSPYLLQHADNPVDWRPWGDAAFAEARELDRPIFLSIGYATCHWCHVMAHESFEDEQVAELINRAFVPVKVDREERPDVDAVYMTVCQLMNGHGGWPLTVLLTPDRQPFFAGTYFPRESRGGRIGMLDLVPRIEALWNERRSDVRDSAESITGALRSATEVPAGDAPGQPDVDAAVRALTARFDEKQGGFGGAPKFPSPHQLTFLLRAWERSGDARMLDMVTTTLRAMRSGGLHDQLGGGFHRYSTDARWHLPHFEKMLYDQALLSIAYIEGWQATGEPAFADTARRTLDYVLDELADAAGGFHSAEDADSEGVEGKYYLWTEAQLADALPDEADLDFAIDAFGVEPEGNFRDETTGQRSGSNVLVAAAPEELATRHGIPPGELPGRLERIRDRLRRVRSKRIRPQRDDKVLADWNGLAVAALALGGRAFDERRYTEAAERASEFVHDRLVAPGGEALHRWRAGEAAIPAMADDHAFLAWGFVELYETTYEPLWLERAATRLDELLERFEAPGGGFFQTASDAETTLVRVLESSDGAVPSANSVAALTLLRMAHLTGRVDYEAAAHRLLAALGGRVSAAPAAHAALLQAVQFAAGPAAEAVVAGAADDATVRRMLSPLRHDFLPRVVALFKPSDDADIAGRLAHVAPFTEALARDSGEAIGYVCRGHACDRPRTDPAEFEAALRDV